MKNLTILIIIALLILSGGNVQTVAAFPIKVTDDRCKQIMVSERPLRIVALLPLYAEILIDLGVLDLIVGIADSPNNPPEVGRLTKVGPASNPNRELIVSLAPDVVLGATDFNNFREALETANLTVITAGCFKGAPDFGSISGVIDVFKTIRTVGMMAEEGGTKTDALIGRISEEVVSIEGAILDRSRPTAVVLYPDPSGKTPPYSAGGGAPESEIITRAGGTNALANLKGYPQISFEELLRLDPEFIFTDPSRIETITSDSRLQGLKAVKDGKVCGMKASQWTSSRVAKTLRSVAETLHPQAFGKESGPCT